MQQYEQLWEEAARSALVPRVAGELQRATLSVRSGLRAPVSEERSQALSGSDAVTDVVTQAERLTR